MSALAVVLYELVYTTIYLGLLFSKSTFLKYFPEASIIMRVFFLIILLCGFFIPYFIKVLRAKLTSKHYLVCAVVVCVLYALASWSYYTTTLKNRQFHSFLQLPPTEQKQKIPKPPGVFRIVCLGGSTTEGLKAKGYPVALATMLEEKYPSETIEVINAGKYFYSTQHSIIQYLFYLKELEPDLIILFHGVNDLITSFTMPPFSSHPFRRDYGHFFGPLAYIRYPRTFEDFLSGFFYADLLRPNLKPAPFPEFISQHSFRRNLETIIHITESEGIPLILSNQAHCYSLQGDSDPGFLRFQRYFLVDTNHFADEKSWYNGMELFNRIAKETAEKFSVPFVDQSKAFNGRRDLFRESIHMTPEGTQLKARLFFNKIVQLKLLDN